jgi:DNA-binding CsgD family transcriptional regulator
MGNTRTPDSYDTLQDGLSARQKQMVHWLADGLTVAEIAGRFRMPQAAVLHEVVALREAFGARTDAQLVGIAYEAGMFERVRAPWASERDPRGRNVPEVPRLAGLTPKPRATAADARVIAARLEAGFAGVQR